MSIPGNPTPEYVDQEWLIAAGNETHRLRAKVEAIGRITQAAAHAFPRAKDDITLALVDLPFSG